MPGLSLPIIICWVQEAAAQKSHSLQLLYRLVYFMLGFVFNDMLVVLKIFSKLRQFFLFCEPIKSQKIKKKSTVGCLLAFFLIVYHKLQIKTSTVCPLISMAQTVRIWRGSDTRPNKDTCFCVLVKYLLSATSIKLNGICFCMLCCSGYCFVTEWHIHSQAGLEMNADTVHHGYFGVFIFSTSLPSPLLFFPVF